MMDAEDKGRTPPTRLSPSPAPPPARAGPGDESDMTVARPEPMQESRPSVAGSRRRASSLNPRPRRVAGSLRRGPALESQLGEGQLIHVVVDGDDGGVDMQQFHERIDVALRLRTKYKGLSGLHGDETPFLEPSPRPERVAIDLEAGIYRVSDYDPAELGDRPTPPWGEFAADVQVLRQVVSHSGCIRACSHRLGILQERSRMFFLLNAQMEERHNLRKAGGVFASVTKVDGSVMLSKSVEAQELLDYVVDSCTRQPGVTVKLRSGTHSTLSELMQMHGVTDPEFLSVEGLGWQPQLSSGAGLADSNHSPDQNPLGAELRFIFLSVFGSLSARLLKRGFERMQAAHQAAECSVPLHGSSAGELATLAKTMQSNNMGPYPHIRWTLLVRLMQRPPRGSKVTCQTLQGQLDNIFLPILKATIAPDAPENAAVAWLLGQVGAIQLEGLADGAEKEFDPNAKLPEDIPYPSNMNSLYYLYYLHANLCVVNGLRRKYGLNPLQLRCSGNHRTGMDDLLAGYLLCDVINRATKLLDYPTAQYLCGMQGVGLTVSPLADHMDGAFPYQEHPLANFLHRCLPVSIATEAPLLYHHNPNALVEEYASAQKIFRLSALDMTELARNSVVSSTFPPATKRAWLGDRFLQGTNQFAVSQVTNVRLSFREESWQLERNMMRDLYLNRVSEQPAGLSRWHFLSNVRQVEYSTVLDRRVRFPRTVLSGPSSSADAEDNAAAARTAAAAARVARALALRHQYLWVPPRPWEGGGGGPMRSTKGGVEADFQRQTASFNEDEWTYAANDGVFIGFPRNAVHAWPTSLPTLDDYHRDLRELMAICASSEVKEFAHGRLESLDHKFRLHLALNHANEAGTTAERVSSNRDIYQATKVDTHIHMAAGMTPKQILDFVLKKFRGNGDDIAMKKGEEILTLGQLFAKAGITENLTVDQLSVQADHTLFERFDNFNNKYNPMENGDLRSLLLKTDNFMNGRYFAEIIHDVFSQYSRDRYTFAENRVSVYGINIKEWDKLATWFTTHGMANNHNRWIIQVPRVYKVFRSQNVIGSFGQYLQNIFQPLWEASLHPAEHPTVHNFLKHVSGFDSVDNEATIDLPFNPVSPWAWTAVENPPYNYYLYYLYANIRTLNEFRASRGFNTFSMRPHCGESGSDEHLYGAFLCANAIGHGINLRNDPPMQYLYYLAQIGLHVSPLSNNALFLRFLSNPFPDFFRRGLNVSLSTDDPMMFHQTQEPLIEEYSIAARVWGLSPNDLCEIARNSVLQCGFTSEFKKNAIGEKWFMSSSQGNDPLRTHLSDIRVAYRFETYHTEVQHLEQCCRRPVHRFMLTEDEERDIDDQILGPMEEEIVMSTHDQEMEVVLRDMENMLETSRATRTHMETLRRQEKSLVDNITEVGMRRQELLQELQRELNQDTKLHYTRDAAGPRTAAHDEASPFRSAYQLTAERVLRWRPMPPSPQRHVQQVSLNATKGRSLPPL